MARYRVTLEERVEYTLSVEADDEDHAIEVAKELWNESDYPSNEFDSVGYGVTDTDVALTA